MFDYLIYRNIYTQWVNKKKSRETGSYKVLKQEKLFFVLFVLQFWAEKETQDGFHSLTWNPFSQK